MTISRGGRFAPETAKLHEYLMEDGHEALDHVVLVAASHLSGTTRWDNLVIRMVIKSVLVILLRERSMNAPLDERDKKRICYTTIPGEMTLHVAGPCCMSSVSSGT